MYISQRGQVWGSHSDEEREYKVKQTKNIMEKKQDPAYNTEKETVSKMKYNNGKERKFCCYISVTEHQQKSTLRYF